MTREPETKRRDLELVAYWRRELMAFGLEFELLCRVIEDDASYGPTVVGEWAKAAKRHEAFVLARIEELRVAASFAANYLEMQALGLGGSDGGAGDD